MALSLGVHTGSMIKVGSTPIKVVSIDSGDSLRLDVLGESITVTPYNRVEILPEVYVSVGRNANNNPSPRLCFEADRSIPILRLP